MKKDQKSEKRILVLRHLGGVCNWCGCRDLRILEIDHILGDRGTTPTSVYLREAMDPEQAYRFQVLCPNCHTLKTKGYAYPDWVEFMPMPVDRGLF